MTGLRRWTCTVTIVDDPMDSTIGVSATDNCDGTFDVAGPWSWHFFLMADPPAIRRVIDRRRTPREAWVLLCAYRLRGVEVPQSAFEMVREAM